MERAIGVIDSGVGGLTVVHELMRQLPNEQLIYLGDTLRCPYGSRPEAEVKQFTWEMVNFLLTKQIKMIVVACNTATAYTLQSLKDHLNIPVIGVIQPGARAAIKSTKTNKIGVIGTEGTINSYAYPQALNRIKRELEISSLACPTFVPMVERGVLSGDEAVQTVRRVLKPLTDNNELDTLILGCTHYPLIEEPIQHVVGDRVKIISSSEETARETSTILDVHHLLYREKRTPQHQFYTTGDLNVFKHISKTVFKQTVPNLKTVTIEKVTI